MAKGIYLEPFASQAPGARPGEPGAPRGAVAEARAQLARELPERLVERLAALRREREALAAVLRTYPEGAARCVRELRAVAERANAGAAAAGQVRKAVQAQLAEVPVWRRRQRGGLARESSRLEQEAVRLDGERVAALRQAEALARAPGGLGTWEAAYPGARERYRALADEIRSAEQAVGEVTSAGALGHPPLALVRALGRRPGEPGQRHLWDAAVRAIAAYRQEHGMSDDGPTTLGRRPPGGRERAAWEAAMRAAERACAAMGRLPDLPALGDERLRDIGLER